MIKKNYQTSRTDFFGTKKTIVIYGLANGNCQNCFDPIAIKGFNVSHIEAKQIYIENNLKIDNRLSNVVALCETCNKKQGTINGFDFYPPETVNYIKSRNSQIQLAKNPNDVRTILNVNIRCQNEEILTKKRAAQLADLYAKENPFSKFAAQHQNGRYRQYKDA
jgi:hypothetical protein